MSVTFKYGDYEFKPRPLFSISSEPLKTPDGSGWGVNHTISLEGDILLTGGYLEAGTTGLFGRIDDLREALSQDGYLLVATCATGVGGTGRLPPIISGRPVINSFSFEPQSDNYTKWTKYNVEFTMPTLQSGTGNDPFNNGSGFPPFIQSFNESWESSIVDGRTPLQYNRTYVDPTGATVILQENFGYQVEISHTLDIQGRIAYTGDGPTDNSFKEPWKSAYDFGTGYLTKYEATGNGVDLYSTIATGIIGLPVKNFMTNAQVYNRNRTSSVNKTDGSVSITETFTLTASGTNFATPADAIETFDVDISTQEGVVLASINGEIQGLESVSYSGGTNAADSTIIANNLTQTGRFKIDAARNYYKEIHKNFYGRVLAAHSGAMAPTGTYGASCVMQRKPYNIIKTSTYGENPILGTVSYSVEYDSSTQGCITGQCILSQNITIDDQLQTDVIAQQVVIGRATGPILQDLGTTTARVKNITVEVVTIPPTSCDTLSGMNETNPSGQVSGFIEMIYLELSGAYDQVFTTANNESWNFTNGRYTKNVSFTYINCSGT